MWGRGLGCLHFFVIWPRWWPHGLRVVLTPWVVHWYLTYSSEVMLHTHKKKFLNVRWLGESYWLPITTTIHSLATTLILLAYLILLIRTAPTCALDFIPACLFKNITLRSLFCVSHIKKKKFLSFIFGCTGSSWLPRASSRCSEWGLLSSYGAQVSDFSGLSSCTAWA